MTIPTKGNERSVVVLELARCQANPLATIAGYHLSCFNQIETTDSRLRQSIEDLE